MRHGGRGYRLVFGRDVSQPIATGMRRFIRQSIKVVCIALKESQSRREPSRSKSVQRFESHHGSKLPLPSTPEHFLSLRACRSSRRGSPIKLSTFTLSCFARAGFETWV